MRQLVVKMIGQRKAAKSKGLVMLGHPIERKPVLDLFFGGVQAMHLCARGIIGMADPRRDGIAMGV